MSYTEYSLCNWCFNVCSVYKSWDQNCALKESCESAFEPTKTTLTPHSDTCGIIFKCKTWLRISASILEVIKLNRKLFFSWTIKGPFLQAMLCLYLSSVIPLNWSSATECGLTISSPLQNGGTDLAWLGWCHPHMQTLAMVLPSQLASRSHWGRNWGVSWSGEVVTYQSHACNARRSNEGDNATRIKKEVWKLCFYLVKEGTLFGETLKYILPKLFSSSVQLFCSNNAYQSVYRLAEMTLPVALWRQRGRERNKNCSCNTQL